MISRALADFAIPPKMLVLELTEHHSIEALDTIAVAASRLALRGCGIAIDDFGRGTTSLERLLELPISEVKIGREIFQNCVEQELSRPILQEVIRFCRSHQIDCVVGSRLIHSQKATAVASATPDRKLAASLS